MNPQSNEGTAIGYSTITHLTRGENIKDYKPNFINKWLANRVSKYKIKVYNLVVITLPECNEDLKKAIDTYNNSSFEQHRDEMITTVGSLIEKLQHENISLYKDFTNEALASAIKILIKYATI